MSMFDVSGTEFLIILLVALVVFGPKRLPELARRIGDWTREVRKTAVELRRGLEQEVEELKAPLEEARKQVEELKQPLQEAAAEIERLDVDPAPRKPPGGEAPGGQSTDPPAAGSDDVAWVGPVPESGPTPAEAMEDLEIIEAGGDPGEGDAEHG